MSLTLTEILAAQDRKPLKVDVPEWGGEVWVVGMSGDDRDRFDSTWGDRVGQSNESGPVDLGGLRALVVSKTLCDDDGVLLCSRESEVTQLGRKSSAALDRVFAIGAKLSGIELGDEETVGN
jgi:hypothetical protein